MALTTVTVAALALAGGTSARVVLLGIGAVFQPILTGLGIAVWAALRRRRSDPARESDAEAAFLGAVAAELASGSPPRAALVAAASRGNDLDMGRAARLAAAGMDAGRVAEELRSAMPVHGRLAAAAWHLTAAVGGPAAAIFEMLAMRAADEGVLRRERRALTTQARASAAVVAGLPVLLLGGMALSGRLAPAPGDPLGIVLAVGIGLEVAGVAVVVAMLRRAS
jgi:tight adherence protein B